MIIGDILILKRPIPKGEAKKLLGNRIKTVCWLKGIKGIERQPEIEVIAGNGTETVHRETGCLFAIDIAQFMWARGNAGERQRLARLVQPGETVIDMFAGIGYWSIPIAKSCPECNIIAIDINSKAIEYLRKNCTLNRIENIRAFHGDCRSFSERFKGCADRVILGWLFGPEKFLEHAVKMLKNRGILHLHFLDRYLNRSVIVELIEKTGCRPNIIYEGKVKKYAPRVLHKVMDIRIDKD
ncbi:MAG: methyltransferase domain-containing protein [Candidatus Aenigmatarchaeota archaeon]